MFLWSGGGTKTKHAIFVKNVRSPERSFFSKIPLFFGVKRRTNERSERNCVAKAGVAAAENELSERKAEGGDRRETTEPNRASGASEHLPTK